MALRSSRVTGKHGINHARRPHVTSFTPRRPGIGQAVLGPLSDNHSMGMHTPFSRRNYTVYALGGPGDRKGLKREDEPEEYWSSERERKGESPFKDPVALIGILAILFPFVLLLILNAAGVVDLTPQ